MRLARQVAGANRDMVGRPEGMRPLANLDIDGMIILKWICKRYDGVAWTGLLWLRTGTGGGHLWMW